MSKGPVKSYTINLDIPLHRLDDAVAERSGAPPIVSELVRPGEVLVPAVYKRLESSEKKERYRSQLLIKLNNNWKELYGLEKARKISQKFECLTKHLDENGAIIFAALLPTRKFKKLIERYDALIADYGSNTWIHSYVNLANHPGFLADEEFNAAFLHPLLVAMISYRIGGSIRIVDARGKNAEPISVLAQDNMLHIDNTPFNDEYKILLTWEKNRPSGPRGQNFVFLPGTHKGCRNCFSTGRGAWSTENASIFVSPESIDRVLKFQQEIQGLSKPMVVEASHTEKPLTTIFPSGSLVHHRYRTERGLARSCLIIAFHREGDNPGQLIPKTHLDGITEKGSLCSFLLGHHAALGKNSYLVEGPDEDFLRALSKESATMGAILEKLDSEMDAAEVIRPETCQLNEEELEQWRVAVTDAPTVEKLKAEANLISLEEVLSPGPFVGLIGKMMMFDKHGPLDLILYHDNHEEIRKWARNQIREKKPGEVCERLRAHWMPQVEQPKQDQLLTPQKLRAITEQLTVLAKDQEALDVPTILHEDEKISRADAYRSVQQLLLDLGESITRCENCQTFLSTSLFIFWACDMLVGFHCATCDSRIKDIGNKLLANYISTCILFEKQARK